MTETKSKPSGETAKIDKAETLVATLSNDAEAAVADVRAHATSLGALSTTAKGRKVTIELPAESVRNPSDKRQKLIDGLAADPHVVSVESS